MTPSPYLPPAISLLATMLWLAFSNLPSEAQTLAPAGGGSYLTAPPPDAKGPPATIYKTDRVLGATPTNRWWSSLAWLPFSERQFPHPLAIQASSAGLRVFYPGDRIHVTEKAVFAGMPGGGEDLLLQHSEQDEFPDARLDGHSDWFVRARFATAGRSMTVSYGHGSPYIYAVYENGSPVVTFAREAEVWAKTGWAKTGTGTDRPDSSQFPCSTLGLVWGGKADYATWFSAKPEAIYGINWLPFHGGSLYLGRHPEYVQRNYQSLAAKKGGAGWDEWADLIWMYRALYDAPAALADFTAGRPSLQPEAGQALTHTQHWIAALADVGQVDRHVTADTPLYAVFRQAQRRTYVVYNGSSQPQAVRFSDGFAIPHAAAGFSVVSGPAR